MILAALNFDLSFFTSIPGMLITGGVLLLIIALVIFIATSNKEKNKNKTDKGVEQAQQLSAQEAIIANTPAVDANVTPQEAASVLNQGVMNQMPSPMPETEPSVFTNPIPMEQTPTNFAEAPSVEIVLPTFDSVAPAAPMPEAQPLFEQQVPPAPSAPVEPTVVQPVMPEVPTSFTEVSQAPQVEVVAPEPQIEPVAPTPYGEERPIYGGVSSVIPNMAQEEEPRPIYGGANPLENTGNIQVQEPIAPTPTVEVPAVESVIEQPVVTSAAEPLNSQNVQEQVIEQSAIPAVEPIAVEPIAQVEAETQNMPTVQEQEPVVQAPSIDFPTITPTVEGQVVTPVEQVSSEPVIPTVTQTANMEEVQETVAETPVVEFPTVEPAVEQPTITPADPTVVEPTIPVAAETLNSELPQEPVSATVPEAPRPAESLF